MRRAEHKERMGKAKMHTVFWCENKEERDHLEGLEVNGRVL